MQIQQNMQYICVVLPFSRNVYEANIGHIITYIYDDCASFAHEHVHLFLIYVTSISNNLIKYRLDFDPKYFGQLAS